MAEAEEKVIIKLEHIKKCYGKKEVLKDMSLDIYEGDIFGLIGKNGAGKSTLFKVILGMSEYQNGSVEILGQTKNLEKCRKHMGFFIGTNLFGYMTAEQNMKYYATLKGIKHSKEETQKILKLVGLEGVKTKVKGFSLGMRQRLGIAVAILGKPKILILDEPTNGLDPQGIKDIRSLVKKLNKEYGMTVIISSHILGELQNTATRFGIINNGVLVRELTQEDLQIDDKVVRLKVDDLEKAKELLAQGGVEVLEEQKETASLESFYFSLIGGGEKDA